MLYEPLSEQLYFLRKFRSSDNLDDEELIHLVAYND